VEVRLALDTNRYTDLCRGAAEVVTLVEHAEAVFLPFVVLAELRAGFAIGTRGAENERVLRGFLRKPGVAVLFAEDPDDASLRYDLSPATPARDADPDQ
jgi:predicted nucleic acid-binding protein